MVILTINSLTLYELIVNKFIKNLCEKTKSRENWQSYSVGCSLNGRNLCTDVWHSRELYSKQTLYTKQNFSSPNRLYTKLDLVQSGHIPKYHWVEYITVNG